MKRYLDAVIHVSFFVLIGVAILLNNSEVCMAKEFDASLNVMGYDRNVTVKINGVHISRITGGNHNRPGSFLPMTP